MSKGKSDNVVILAPTSFTSSAQRIFKIAEVNSFQLKWLLLMPIAILLALTA